MKFMTGGIKYNEWLQILPPSQWSNRISGVDL